LVPATPIHPAQGDPECLSRGAPIRPTIEPRPTFAAYDVDPEAAMNIRSRVLVWHTALLLRRANHQRRSVLRRELASYTPRELLDLEAVIERYPLGQTHELRSILSTQRLQRAWSHPPHAA
jgi:hypothetical protein